MSELAMLTREVSDLIAQVKRLDAPIHRSLAVIERATAETARAQRTPELRREAMVRHDALQRGERALKQALAASRRSSGAATKWMTQHAAHGGRGGAGGGPELAAINAPRAGDPAALLANVQDLADRVGHERFLGYAFGLTTAVVVGAGSPLLHANVEALVDAVCTAALPPLVSAAAISLIVYGSDQLIKFAAGKEADAKDGGDGGGALPQGLAWLRHQGRPDAWSAEEWRAEGEKIALGVAVAGFLVWAHAGVLAAAAASALGSGIGWSYAAVVHDRAHHGGRR
jgi:hypothetical protein